MTKLVAPVEKDGEVELVPIPEREDLLECPGCGEMMEKNHEESSHLHEVYDKKCGCGDYEMRVVVG